MRHSLRRAFAAAALASAVAPVAHANTIVLSENFEGIPGGTYFTGQTVGSFNVQSGSIDILDSGFFGGLCSAAGGSVQCVDLDGNAGATLTSNQLFGAGTYNLTFDLAGSQRGQSNTTVLFIGDQNNVAFTPAADDLFQTISVNGITIGASGSFLTFFQEGADAVGNLLDNVRLERVDPAPGNVPAPATSLLLAAGLGAAWLRRRGRVTA